MAREFDPGEKGVDDVLRHLEKADEKERSRVLSAELSGKKRKTILSEYNVDPDARLDATGRPLYPWEVSPEQQVGTAGAVARGDLEASPEPDGSVQTQTIPTEQGGSDFGGGVTAAGAPTGGGAPVPGPTTAGDTPGNTGGITR